MPRRWYDIKNSASDSAEVFIYEEIGCWGISAKHFIDDLKALAGKALTLRIHSYGGEVLDGHAIYNALLRHSGGVTVQIDGVAASMASVIAMVGAPVKIAANGFLMIHNPANFTYGDSREMKKSADLLDKMRDGLVNIYTQKTGLPPEEIEALMDDETWLTAEEAMEKGFVDEITDEVKAVAKFDPKKAKAYRNIPAALVDTEGEYMPKPKARKNFKAAPPRAGAKSSRSRSRAEEEEHEEKPENEEEEEETPENEDENEPTLEEQVEQLIEAVEELEQKQEELEEKVEEAEEARDKARAESKRASASVERITKQRDDLTAKLTKANEIIAANALKITDLEASHADFEARASARAQQILAANGHAPLNLGAEGNPGGGGTQDNSHLKGADRVRAAFNKQFAKK